MTLHELLSIFTPVTDKLPNELKTLIEDLSQIKEFEKNEREEIAELKKTAELPEATALEIADDLKKIVKDKEDKLNKIIEDLRKNLLKESTSDLYDFMLIQKKSIKTWISEIILAFTRLYPLNEKDEDGYMCPISSEVVNEKSFPLMDGYLYQKEILVRNYDERSKPITYPVYRKPLPDEIYIYVTNKMKFSIVDKIAVMTAQKLENIPEIILHPEAVEIDKVVTSTVQPPPAPPSASIDRQPSQGQSKHSLWHRFTHRFKDEKKTEEKKTLGSLASKKS